MAVGQRWQKPGFPQMTVWLQPRVPRVAPATRAATSPAVELVVIELAHRDRRRHQRPGHQPQSLVDLEHPSSCSGLGRHRGRIAVDAVPALAPASPSPAKKLKSRFFASPAGARPACPESAGCWGDAFLEAVAAGDAGCRPRARFALPEPQATLAGIAMKMRMNRAETDRRIRTHRSLRIKAASIMRRFVRKEQCFSMQQFGETEQRRLASKDAGKQRAGHL